MSLEVLEQFWETTDPLLLGYAHVDQLGLMLDMTGGLAWPHVDGPLFLKRRPLYPTPQPWQDGLWCGAAPPDATTIKNWPGFGHAANMGYQYALFRSFGNGYVSEACEPVRVDFDAAGDPITPALPKWPEQLRGLAIAGGKFRLTWIYDPWGQGGWPTDFAVYAGATPGTIDYNTPIGTVDFVAGTRQFEYVTGAYGEGVNKAFGVRARNVTPVAEKNTLTTPILTARATGPADPASVYVGATRRPVR